MLMFCLYADVLFIALQTADTAAVKMHFARHVKASLA
jgi:hypothetical protein